MNPELSRTIDVRHLPERFRVEAGEAERQALAKRFALEDVSSLSAEVALAHDGDAVSATGSFTAEILQACAVSGEPFPVRISEPLALRFVPALTEYGEDDEIELDADEPDEIPFEGTQFDLGEAIAQSLGLAIDPYATGPDADRARKEAGLSDESASGPFAALAALRK